MAHNTAFNIKGYLTVYGAGILSHYHGSNAKSKDLPPAFVSVLSGGSVHNNTISGSIDAKTNATFNVHCTGNGIYASDNVTLNRGTVSDNRCAATIWTDTGPISTRWCVRGGGGMTFTLQTLYPHGKGLGACTPHFAS